MILRIGLRNLLAHRLKTAVQGALMAIAAAFIVVGAGILGTIDRVNEESVVNALTGDIQLYSADSRDRFQLGGTVDGFEARIEPMEDFPRVARVIGALDNVEAVVPMGADRAHNTLPNYLELRLAQLRQAVRTGDDARIARIGAHVRRILGQLKQELVSLGQALDAERRREDLAAVRRALTESFWRGFASDPLTALEYLENEVGPIGMHERVVFLRYIGTDTAQFARHFDRFELVDGEMIPPGRRGFMFNKYYFETQIKNRVAHRLDEIARRRERGERIATCAVCRRWIGDNVRQAAWLAFQIDGPDARAASGALQPVVGGAPDLLAQLKRFLRMDDASFDRRYKLFYDVIAPRIRLYDIGVGEELVLTGVAQRGGYVRRVPVKVYGTFKFSGLEHSPVAGVFNLMDIMTFRDLYGLRGGAPTREQQQIRASIGVKQVDSKDEVEAMFSADDPLVEEVDGEPGELPEVAFSGVGRRHVEQLLRRRYTRRQIHDGAVLNAAVVLADSSRRAETLARVRAAIRTHSLGLRAIDWKAASGRLAQALRVVRLVLVVVALVLLLVVIIVISNALLMSTLERVPEIGTMRAMGAGKGVVLRMLVVESITAALLFGGLGVALGYLVLRLLGSSGIPAWNLFTEIIFAGDRLYPAFRAGHAVFAVVAVVLVALASTLYPTLVATRVSPREAMSRG